MKKPINAIIAEYVERKDVKGLAEYFNAYIDDEFVIKSQIRIEGYDQGFLDGQNDVLEDIKHEQQKLLDGWGHPKGCWRCKKTSPRRD